MAQNGELKKFNATPSGRSSIISGAKKFARGFVVRPEQVLELLHDTQPDLPLPNDAQFRGIGVDDAGINSLVEFYFTSQVSPNTHCLALKPLTFFHMLLNLADGLLPLDSELDGIEVSRNFTVILLRVISSHWPPPLGKDLPLYHLRYEFGRLLLVDPSKAIENERRIRIH